MKKHAGFTLIELVVVIVLLGILSSVALPKFIDLNKDAKYATLKHMKGSLEEAINFVESAKYIPGRVESDGIGGHFIDFDGTQIKVSTGITSPNPEDYYLDATEICHVINLTSSPIAGVNQDQISDDGIYRCKYENKTMARILYIGLDSNDCQVQYRMNSYTSKGEVNMVGKCA